MKATDFFELRILMDNEGKESLTKLLRAILIVVLVTIPAAITIRYFDDRVLSSVDLALLLLFIAYTFAYFLIKRGGFLTGSLLFIMSGWMAMTFLAGRSEGIKDVVITGYILLIYLATLLTGYRFAIAITAMSVISIWVMAILEENGVLIPFRDSPIYYARDFTFFIIIVIAFIILVERIFGYSFNRIQKELHERTEAEEKLKINEKKLKRQNDELRAARIKAEESNRLKTAFLKNVSQEILIPMNCILGLSEMIKSRDITVAERADCINRLLSYSGQLAILIDDLIDFSKLESGAVEIVRSDFKAEELLNDAHKLYRMRAEEKGLSLEIINGLGDTTLRSDRLKIKLIVNSLADNAVKFTDRGSVAIYAGIRDNNLIIKVTDTGTGIDKEDIPFIFEHARQPEPGLKKASRGAGLGLSICKGNLRYLGGNIMVESESGKGSVFTVSIPVEISDRI